ncbi:MAG: DUF2062 domain-containing protein [Candidatus Aureabacteria bacterium]|nr:DUF2062 domain-containing protein [Candidatus Auribacterota bacterium]
MPRKWLRKRLPKKDYLKNSIAFRILGERLFQKDLWHFSRRSFAGGLALGLFVAFTPTFPLQMAIAAVGAIVFRVNLPIAVLSCWITNPLTLVFFYQMEIKLGSFLLGNIEDAIYVKNLTGNLKSFFIKGVYLWTGSMVVSVLSAFISYFTVKILWRYLTVKKWQKRKNPKIIDFPAA